jgi:hypothetical protein
MGGKGTFEGLLSQVYTVCIHGCDTSNPVSVLMQSEDGTERRSNPWLGTQLSLVDLICGVQTTQ